MRPQPPDPDSPDKQRTKHFDSLLGYGGVIIDSAGFSHPMPEHEAIAGAIPYWVTLPEHEADTLDSCLQFATHDHPAVRAAAIEAFGELARRYGRLGEHDKVVRAIELGLRDVDDQVRGAAARSGDMVQAKLGWRISRPGA